LVCRIVLLRFTPSEHTYQRIFPVCLCFALKFFFASELRLLVGFSSYSLPSPFFLITQKSTLMARCRPAVSRNIMEITFRFFPIVRIGRKIPCGRESHSQFFARAGERGRRSLGVSRRVFAVSVHFDRPAVLTAIRAVVCAPREALTLGGENRGWEETYLPSSFPQPVLVRLDCPFTLSVS